MVVSRRVSSIYFIFQCTQVCRQRLGQHALAENLFDEAVQIRRTTLGNDHVDVGASLSKLGASQISLRKFDDAYTNLRTALKIYRQNHGNEHRIVAQMLCHLACLFFESGEMLSAQATFEDALEIYHAVFQTETDRDACMVQLTDTLCNIGSIQNRRKRFAEAITTFSEALDLQRGIVGLNDARIVSTLDNLGYAYSRSKDYAHALSCYKQMLRAQIGQYKVFNHMCYDTFRKEILMYEKLKKFSEAAESIREIIQIQTNLPLRDEELFLETRKELEGMQKKCAFHRR
jgi:tetratricopeptide (TPR) repeat protein